MAEYFSIGNVGKTDQFCTTGQVNYYDMDYNMENFKIDCEIGKEHNHTIRSITTFGLLYKWDKRLGTASTGESFCNVINGNPEDGYLQTNYTNFTKPLAVDPNAPEPEAPTEGSGNRMLFDGRELVYMTK